MVNVVSGEPAIHYSLNGLLDRAGNNGVLPHITTLARLRRIHPTAYLLLSTEIPELKGKFGKGVPELDLLGFVKQEFVAGGVKTRCVDFDEPQLERDFGLSEAVGASVHIVGCLEPVSEEVIARVQAKREQTGMRVLIIDGVIDGEI